MNYLERSYLSIQQKGFQVLQVSATFLVPPHWNLILQSEYSPGSKQQVLLLNAAEKDGKKQSPQCPLQQNLNPAFAMRRGTFFEVPGTGNRLIAIVVSLQTPVWESWMVLGP